jgi:hypothetical protein
MAFRVSGFATRVETALPQPSPRHGARATGLPTGGVTGGMQPGRTHLMDTPGIVMLVGSVVIVGVLFISNSKKR